MAQFECPQCGAPLSPDLTQCPYCGENVQPTQSGYQQTNPGTYQQPYEQPQTTYQQPQPNYQQPQPNYQQPQPNYQQPQPNYYQQPQPNMYQQQPQPYNNYGGQPVYQNPYPYPQPFEPGVNPAWPVKNKVVAGILGIILGAFGIHKFYLGKTGMGLLYLLFFWTGIPAVVGLIEGIIYLCSNDHNFQINNHVRLQ